MNSSEEKYIRTLFEKEKYLELYQVESKTINMMLSIDDQKDFEDFLESEDLIDEDVFWLHYAVVYGKSLLIGGYEGDVTKRITDFLKQWLSDDMFSAIQEYLQYLYVDIDEEDNLKEKIGICNQHLTDFDCLLQLDYDDTYYAGAYFLSVRPQ